MKNLLLLTGLLAVSQLAAAFNFSGRHWESGNATFHVGMEGASATGLSWNQAFEEAMAQWNEHTDFRFYIEHSYQDPCQDYGPSAESGSFPEGSGDGRNGVDFNPDVCGNAFGEGVVAITLSRYFMRSETDSPLTQTDIIFNSNRVWDIYDGNSQRTVDFRRTALHELGHALGLDHEGARPSIMSPSITNLYTLQHDDISGVNALYGVRVTCQERWLPFDRVVDDSLQQGDCTYFDFDGSPDSSYLDVYRLNLTADTALSLTLESASLDPVLLILDASSKIRAFDDDSAGACNARISVTLPAGDYRVLANTYAVPSKCRGNTGSYRLTLTSNDQPLLTRARNIDGSTSSAIFSGGARLDGSSAYQASFQPEEVIDVVASMRPELQHVGRQGSIYVLAVLDDGRQFYKRPGGAFMRLREGAIPAYRADVSLNSREDLALADNLQGLREGLRGVTVNVYVGYTVDSDPSNIHFNGQPLTFTIQP